MHETAAEVVRCRIDGNIHGYGEGLRDLEAAGLKSKEIQELLERAEHQLRPLEAQPA